LFLPRIDYKKETPFLQHSNLTLGKVKTCEGLQDNVLSMFRGFTNMFSRRATGFHRQAKLLELNFFERKTFH